MKSESREVKEKGERIKEEEAFVTEI